MEREKNILQGKGPNARLAKLNINSLFSNVQYCRTSLLANITKTSGADMDSVNSSSPPPPGLLTVFPPFFLRFQENEKHTRKP